MSIRDLDIEICQWTKDVSPLTPNDTLLNTELCQSVQDTITIDKKIISHQFSEIQKICRDYRNNESQLNLFTVREQVLEVLRLIYCICGNALDYATVFHKDDMRDKIQSTVTKIYNHIAEIQKKSDEFYYSDYQTKFRKVYADGKKMDRILWSRDCIDVDDDNE